MDATLYNACSRIYADRCTQRLCHIMWGSFDPWSVSKCGEATVTGGWGVVVGGAKYARDVVASELCSADISASRNARHAAVLKQTPSKILQAHTINDEF